MQEPTINDQVYDAAKAELNEKVFDAVYDGNIKLTIELLNGGADYIFAFDCAIQSGNFEFQKCLKRYAQDQYIRPVTEKGINENEGSKLAEVAATFSLFADANVPTPPITLQNDQELRQEANYVLKNMIGMPDGEVTHLTLDSVKGIMNITFNSHEAAKRFDDFCGSKKLLSGIMSGNTLSNHNPDEVAFIQQTLRANSANANKTFPEFVKTPSPVPQITF